MNQDLCPSAPSDGGPRLWTRLGVGSGHFEVLRIGSPGPGACVVKRCLPEERHRDDLAHRLHNEGRHLTRLRGLRVPELHRFLPDPPSLVMRWIDGTPLDDWLRAGPDLPTALGTFDALLQLVSEIHGRGTVHRDIKPANVLVDGSGRPWLIDFELACDADAERSMGRGWIENAAGTVPYAPPELRTHPTFATAPVIDVYALGKLLEDVLETLGETSGPLEFLVAKATSGDASYRFESADALRAELHRVLAPGLMKRVRSIWQRWSRSE